MSDLRMDLISVTPAGGDSIIDAIHDSIRLATAHRTDVNLRFNNTIVRVPYRVLVDSLYRDWARRRGDISMFQEFMHRMMEDGVEVDEVLDMSSVADLDKVYVQERRDHGNSDCGFSVYHGGLEFRVLHGKVTVMDHVGVDGGRPCFIAKGLIVYYNVAMVAKVYEGIEP